MGDGRRQLGMTTGETVPTRCRFVSCRCEADRPQLNYRPVSYFQPCPAMPSRTKRPAASPAAPSPTQRSPRRSGPRWRRLPEERPRQILEAALDVFGERGLAGARLDDIARRAGVSKGTIYLYFPNKEELFREVIRAIVVDRLRQAAADAGEDNPVDELKRY